MYVDDTMLICDGQEMIGAAAAVDYSLYALNLGTVRDVGKGEPAFLVINVTTAFTSGTSTGTVVFALIDEEDETLDGSSVVIVQTAPLLVTRLTAGKIIVIPIPAGLITQQYLGVKTTYAEETVTAGKIDAFIAVDVQTNFPSPSS